MTKFAIGCLVQWYEVNIIDEYIDSLKDSLEFYDGDVYVDFVIAGRGKLSSFNGTDEEYNDLIDEISKKIDKLNPLPVYGMASRNVETDCTIAEYRRQFNDKWCDKVDVLVWGEPDMLSPKQMFTILDSLHQQVSEDTPKYLSTFAIHKMWDNSWKPLEHVDFTDKPFIDGDTENWWSLRYVMSKEEMNTFNDKIAELDVTTISPHKFQGCGLAISSEVIRAGVNIPKSVFFIHEDTSFMLMTQKVLGNIPQYHFKNVLMVHNRKHPNKRSFVSGEEHIDKNDVGAQRKAHDWYKPANKLCEQNCYNLFNPNYKSKTWEDVWK